MVCKYKTIHYFVQTQLQTALNRWTQFSWLIPLALGKLNSDELLEEKKKDIRVSDVLEEIYVS